MPFRSNHPMKIKKKLLAILQEAWREGSLVKIKRDHFDDSDNGFVIDISAGWLLVHYFDADFFQFDGYSAVRLRDITGVEKNTSWIPRACREKGLEPTLQPDVLIADLPGLLSSVNSHHPVLGIEREAIDPDTLHIGRVKKLRSKAVVLHEIGRQAEWHSDNTAYRLKDITRVTFGSTYMKHLLDFARSQEAEAASEKEE